MTEVIEDGVVGKTAADAMFGEDKAVFDRGMELLKEVPGKMSMTTGFDGEGLLAVRKTVLRVLHLTEAIGGPYNQSFGRAIAGTPYAERGEDWAIRPPVLHGPHP